MFYLCKYGMRLVLPAHAGMIPRNDGMTLYKACAPRTCGDDPLAPHLVPRVAQVLPAHAGMIPRRLR